MANGGVSGYGILSDEDPWANLSHQSGYMLPNGNILNNQQDLTESDYVPIQANTFDDHPIVSFAFEHEGYGQHLDSSFDPTDGHNFVNGFDNDDFDVPVQNTDSAALGNYNIHNYGSLGSSDYSLKRESTGDIFTSSLDPVFDVSHEQIDGAISTHPSQSHASIPLVQRDVARTASTTLVIWNLINLMLSGNLMALPYAIASGGYIVIFCIGLFGILTIYTSRILVDLTYEQSDQPLSNKIQIRNDYAHIALDAMKSSKVAAVVHILQVFEMFAICVLNICVLGQLCHEIFPKVSIQVCTAIMALLALPSFFIKALNVIGWLQTIGMVSLGVGLTLIEVYCLANAKKWTFDNVFAYDLKKLPVSLGIVVYGFGLHSILPGLEQQIKKQSSFKHAVCISSFLAVVVQIFFSLTNSLLYGKSTAQVITIDLEKHFGLGIATSAFIGVSILCRFALPTAVVMETLDRGAHRLFSCFPRHDEHSRRHTVLMITLRVLIVGLAAAVAILLPYYAVLMSLFGCTITVLLSMVLPCLFHLRLRYSSTSRICVFIDILVIIFGFACFGFGTFFVGHEIYKRSDMYWIF